MSRKSLYRNSKMTGAPHCQYPKERTHSRPKGTGRHNGAGRENGKPRFFDGADRESRLLIDYAKLDVLVRQKGGDGWILRPAWAGVLMRMSSQVVEEIRITTERPGPQLFEALLAKAAAGAGSAGQ